MPTSIFNMLKYAKTGIAAQGMTGYDKQCALSMCKSGIPTSTITGVPPIPFTSDGSPLISLLIKGNGQQSGTPAPDNILPFDGCGERTENFLAANNTSATVNTVTISNENGKITVTGRALSEITSTNAAWKNAFTFRLKAGSYYFAGSASGGVSSYLRNANDDTRISMPNESFVLANDTTVYVGFYVYNNNDKNFNIMLNLGSSPIPYEPYGWIVPVTCAGQTVPVYLGQTQTLRRIKKLVLTGEEFWMKSGAYQGSFYAQIVSNTLSESYTAYCTHLTFSTLSQYAKGKFCFNGGAVKNCNLWFNQFDSSTTTDDFKTYLQQQYAAGTPVTVWYVLAEPETGIVNEPLCKIGDYCDELSSTDAGVSIPTVKGQNTLTVDTSLAPSSVSITGHIKQ